MPKSRALESNPTARRHLAKVEQGQQLVQRLSMTAEHAPETRAGRFLLQRVSHGCVAPEAARALPSTQQATCREALARWQQVSPEAWERPEIYEAS
jgi:hypothetical protein